MWAYSHLDVLIDNALNIRPTVDDKYNNVNFRVYQLRKIRPYLTSNIALRIRKQTILSLMDYSGFMVESSPTSWVERLEKLQLRALNHIDDSRLGNYNEEAKRNSI